MKNMTIKQIILIAFLTILLNALAIYFGLKPNVESSAPIAMSFFIFAELSICLDMVVLVVGGTEFYDWLGQ